MPTYVPNAEQVTEPVESREVISAAAEFRTLKIYIAAMRAANDGVDAALDLRLTAAEDAIDGLVAGTLPDGSVTPAKLSGGAPSWDAAGLHLANATEAKYNFDVGAAVKYAYATINSWGVWDQTNARGMLNIDGSTPDVNMQFNSGFGSNATAYGCRAWVNFNGTGTVAIRDSGNITSITDLGVGKYELNLATPMPDANYALTGTARSSSDSSGAALFTVGQYLSQPLTAGVAQIQVKNATADADSDAVYVTIHR